MIELDEFLEHKKSYIAFSIHDSLVIDFAKEERNLIFDIAKIFSGTNFGDFKVKAFPAGEFTKLVLVLPIAPVEDDEPLI